MRPPKKLKGRPLNATVPTQEQAKMHTLAEQAQDAVIEAAAIKDPAINLDREQAFMLFATFCGDTERTAHALGVRPVDVLRIADEEGWLIRLAPIVSLKKSSRPGDVERAMNRAINFVDAHRFRIFLQRLINHFCALTDAEAVAALTVSTEKSVTLSAKPFADLATAIEKMQQLTYVALNDTVTERAKRKPDEDAEHSATEMQAQLDKAMAAAGASETPRTMLFDAQLKLAQVQTNPKTLDK